MAAVIKVWKIRCDLSGANSVSVDNVVSWGAGLAILKVISNNVSLMCTECNLNYHSPPFKFILNIFLYSCVTQVLNSPFIVWEYHRSIRQQSVMERADNAPVWPSTFQRETPPFSPLPYWTFPVHHPHTVQCAVPHSFYVCRNIIDVVRWLASTLFDLESCRCLQT